MIRFIACAIFVMFPSCLFAQGGGGVAVCSVTHIKVCNEMAIKYSGLQGGPCNSTGCLNIAGMWHCPKGIGLTTTVFGRYINDVEPAGTGVPGSTIINQWPLGHSCGDMFTCDCSQVGAGARNCKDLAFLKPFTPIAHSIGMINCVGP